MVQTWVGYLAILLGLTMELAAFLVSLGIVKPVSASRMGATFWDFLIALMQRAPWYAAVGLVLIYSGLKLIGINVPF